MNAKKKKAVIIVVAVIASLAVAAAIVLPSLFYSFRADVPEYSGTERLSEGILPTAEQAANAVKYERVVIFGVDGAGAYFNAGKTPNFDRIFQGGSVTFEGISQYPTSSGENWASMFTGLTVQDHKINNNISSAFPNTYVTTIFKVLHNQNKNATFYSACDWASINIGIIENGCKVTKAYGMGSSDAEKDEDVKNNVLNRLKKHDDMVTFMQFDNVDHIGHESGYGSEEFTAAIQTVDGYMGEIYDAYVEKGLADSTLFICISDHGHKPEGNHGGETDTEKQITFAIAGSKGNIISGTPGKFVTQDLASVVLYALGVEQPESFKSRVPYNMFNTLA